MIIRRDLYSQMIGFLTLENGIAAFAVVALGGVSFFTEMGIFAVIATGVLLMAVLSRKVHELYRSQDTVRLQDLSTEMVLYLSLLVPLLTALVALAPHGERRAGHAAVAGTVLATVGLLALAWKAFVGPVVAIGASWRIDRLSALLILMIQIVAIGVTVASLRYVARERETGVLSAGKVRRYYLLLPPFIAAMLVTVTTDHLGVLWIALETTTLATTPLVALYEKDGAIEAAWKYLLLCSVGISVSLLGLLLLATARRRRGTGGEGRLVAVGASLACPRARYRNGEVGVRLPVHWPWRKGWLRADAHLAAGRAQAGRPSPISARAVWRAAQRGALRHPANGARSWTWPWARALGRRGSSWCSDSARCCSPHSSCCTRQTTNDCWPTAVSSTWD